MSHHRTTIQKNVETPASLRLRRRAQRYLDSHQLVPAQTALEALLQYFPDDYAILALLGSVQWQRGHVQAASKTLLRAARLTAQGIGATADLAKNLLNTGESRAAHACLARIPPNAARCGTSEMVAVARECLRTGDTKRALAWMEHVTASGEHAPGSLYFHALLLQYSGKLDAAEEKLECCLVHRPDFSSAALARSRLRHQSRASNHVEQLLELAGHEDAESLHRARLDFALFKELDDLGQYEQAWVALEHGNAIMHRRNPYDASADEAFADAVVQQPIKHRKGMPSSDGPTPVFIVGMPRSGTTLLDRMLSNHSQVTSAGELQDFFRQLSWVTNTRDNGPRSRCRILAQASNIDSQEIGKRYLEQTQWRAGKHSFYIDKLPANFWILHLIHAALPQAPIIHIKRNPVATCFSNYKAMFGDHRSRYSYDLQQTANYYNLYHTLQRHWCRSLPDVFLEINYEELIENTESTMRKVTGYCKIPFESKCIDPTQNRQSVDTPSSAQVQEPVHSRGMNGWKPYDKHLSLLKKCLSQSIDENCIARFE